MKDRPTKDNIIQIKEELKQLLISEGVINNTASLSKMKHEFNSMCTHTHADEPLTECRSRNRVK